MNMKMSTDDETDQLEQYEFAVVCESIFPCAREAQYVIWLDHHVVSCEYTGFRCELCLRLILEQTQNACQAIESGERLRCARCKEFFKSPVVSDHLRWSKI